MISSRAQDKFITKWNLVANILQKENFKNIPFLNERGVCCGLSFLLAIYVNIENDNEFFTIYHFLNDAAPNTIANLILKNHNQAKSIINFILQLKLLHQKQSDSSPANKNINRKSNEQYTFSIEFTHEQAILFKKTWQILKNNHDRIGNELKTYGTRLLKDYHDIELSIQRLYNYESCIITLFDANFIYGHASVVYKKEMHWIAFDPNDGEKRVFLTTKDASHYFLKQFNELYDFPNNMIMFYAKINSHLSHLQKSLPITDLLTVEQLQKAKDKYIRYKDNRYFGLGWLARHKVNHKASEILLSIRNDKERHHIAKLIVDNNHKNDFIKILMEEVPSLRTKTILQ